MLIVDSHLDLAFCAIQVNRDLTQPAATVRVHDSEPTTRSFWVVYDDVSRVAQGASGDCVWHGDVAY